MADYQSSFTGKEVDEAVKLVQSSSANLTPQQQANVRNNAGVPAKGEVNYTKAFPTSTSYENVLAAATDAVKADPSFKKLGQRLVFTDTNGNVNVYDFIGKNIETFATDESSWVKVNNKLIVITISYDGRNYHSDYSYDQINAFVNSGNTVVLNYQGVLYNLSQVSNSSYSFTALVGKVGQILTVQSGGSWIATQTNFLDSTSVVNDLTTGGAEVPLSAEQGKLLSERSTSSYALTVSTGKSVTISAENHKCGTSPIVKTYYKGVEVISDVAIDASGNVTISWNTTVDSTNKLLIKIIG